MSVVKINKCFVCYLRKLEIFKKTLDFSLQYVIIELYQYEGIVVCVSLVIKTIMAKTYKYNWGNSGKE